jgi:hypothetical protein
MKTVYILLISVFVSVVARAQKDSVEDIDISAIEQKGHSRLFQNARLGALTGASDNFDVKYYRGEWEVDPADRRIIAGKLTLYFKMLSPGQSITLDLMNELTVGGVQQHASPVTFTHNSNLLQINLASSLATGTLDSLTISYQGVPAQSSFESFVTSTHGNPSVPVMWTLSEPFGSRDWWPCKNGLDDKADSLDVFITHPAAYNAVSNGLLKSKTTLPSGKVVTHWKHRYPIAAYLVCFAVTNYAYYTDNVTIGATNMPLMTFCYPESAPVFPDGMANAKRAMLFYGDRFGPYPFSKEKYGHVEFGWGGGMEHQTNTFLVNVSESLVAHELGHHWFGDKITCGSWEDIWLNEGFASYLATIYMEDRYPATALDIRASEIDYITSLPDGSVRVDDVSDPYRVFSNRLSYRKGSHLLFMLRWILGDAAFLQALKNYQDDPSLMYGFASTANLKSHLEAASGKNLTYFFDQWYTGQGYPSYKIEWYATGTSANVKISQTTSHSSVPFFRLPLPLLFKKPSTGQEKLIVVDNTTNGQISVQDIGFAAETVTFDPEHWLITKNNTVTKLSPPLPVIFTSFNIECEPNAVKMIWSTSSEINADHFEIQKSTNSINWHVAGIVEAAGESSMKKDYSFTDLKSVPADVYYRIAEVDRDGTIQLTRIVYKSCAEEGNEHWVISPNPSQHELILKTSPVALSLPSINIFDASGKLVLNSKLTNPVGPERYSINVSSLSTGLYTLVVEIGEVRKALKFIKE